MSTIHKDTNLSIVRVSKVKIGNATTDLNDTVFQCATLIAIKDLHTAGINARWILTLVPRLATISRMVVTNGLYQIKVLINLSLVNLRNGNNWGDRAFLRVVYLGNADAIAVIALGFQNEKSLLKNTGRNAKLPLNAGAYINGSLFPQALSSESLPWLAPYSYWLPYSHSAVREQKSHSHNRGSRRSHPASYRLPAKNGHGLPEEHGVHALLREPASASQSSKDEVHQQSVFSFAEPLKLFNASKKVAAMLVRVITGTPWIAPRAPFDAIVHQNIFSTRSIA